MAGCKSMPAVEGRGGEQRDAEWRGVLWLLCGGLFEADDALKLFEKLYIIARLNEREFKMPYHAPDSGREGCREVYTCLPPVGTFLLSFSTSTCLALLKAYSALPMPAYTPNMGGPCMTLWREGRKFQFASFAMPSDCNIQKLIEITLIHALKHFE